MGFVRFLHVFVSLRIHPFGLKERSRWIFLDNAPFDRFSLVMYPSDHFSLKALFLRAVRRPPSASGLEGASVRLYFLVFPPVTMDFTRAGYVHSLPDAFRARVKWKDSGRLRECDGPRRPDEEAAKEDLESMRAAASGMSREDGCYRRPSVVGGTVALPFRD